MKDKILNRVKGAVSDEGLTSVIVALYLDIHRTTISNWNRNEKQPSLEDIDSIADLLEIENSKLLPTQARVKTGLAKALKKEYDLLIKTMPLEVKVVDEETKKEKTVFNPELVKKIQAFVRKHKEKHNEPRRIKI